jgi:hypothetical protein
MIRMRYLALAVTACVSFSCCAAPPKQTRAECIAGVRLHWKDQNETKASVLNQISRIYGVLSRNYPTAGLSIQNGQYLYIIFSERCEHRKQMMEEILVKMRKDIRYFPRFRYINKMIQPSNKTIQVFGRHWSDGKEPEI